MKILDLEHINTKKKNSLFYFSFFVSLFFTWILTNPSIVFADIEQLTTDTVSEAYSPSFMSVSQSLGTGITGTLNQIQIQILETTPVYYGTCIGVSIFENTTGTWGVDMTQVWYQSCDNYNGYDGVITFDDPDDTADLSYEFSADKYYWLVPQAIGGSGGSQPFYFYGSLTNTYTEGIFLDHGYGGALNDPDDYVADLKFSLQGLNSPSTSENSYITPNQPTKNTNTASTSVFLSATYLYNTDNSFISTPTKIAYSIKRLDINETEISDNFSIVENSVTTVTDTITLTEGGRYEITWAMLDSFNKVVIFANSYEFGVISAVNLPIEETIPTTKIPYEVCDGVSDIFCHLKNAFKWATNVDDTTTDRFISLKDMVFKKAPFGYATAFYNEIVNVTNTTPILVLPQVTAITDTIFTPIRTGLTWLLYFSFVFGMIKRFKDIQL